MKRFISKWFVENKKDKFIKRLLKCIWPEKKVSEKPVKEFEYFTHGKTLYKAKFNEALKVWFVYDYHCNMIMPNTETYSYFMKKLMKIK